MLYPISMLYSIHLIARGDDRSARARAILGVALLHAVGRDKRDIKVSVHIGTKDRLVVAGNRPGKWLLVLATAEAERPQATRPSWPSTT